MISQYQRHSKFPIKDSALSKIIQFRIQSEQKVLKMKWIGSGIFLVLMIFKIEGASTVEEDPNSSRLPKTSYPTHYSLSLSFSVVGTKNYEGNVVINIVMKENTSVITLHNRGLDVLSVNLIDSSLSKLDQKVIVKPERELMDIEVSTRELIAGEKLSLEISFSGQLKTELSGFYRTSYRRNNAIR